MRPTPEQIAEARDRFDYLSFDKESVRELEQKLDSILGKDATKHIRVLLAATEPITDEEATLMANVAIENRDDLVGLDGLDRHDYYQIGYIEGLQHDWQVKP